MGVTRFEDLTAWQKARELVAAVYRISTRFGNDFALRDQLRRAAISVPANIAEGFSRFGPREFHRFTTIARGSIGELKTLLYLSHDVGHLDQKELDEALKMCDRVMASVSSLRSSLRERLKPGAPVAP